MNSHETYETHAAVYAVGALDGDDRARFEAHLAESCDRCEAIVRESHEALARMALAAMPTVPPPDVKAALQARVDAGRRRPGRASRRGWLSWGVATAALVALAVMLASGIVAARYERQLGQMARDVARERARLQAEEAALRSQVAALELLRDPATRVVELRSPSGGDAVARVIWNDKAGGQIIVAKLPPAPEGKAYELWALGAGAPRPAGVFQVDPEGRAAQQVEPAGEIPKGFAVTVEPAQGVPAPTGPIVLASK